MTDDSLFPLKGKKCVIADVSFSGGQVATTLDQEAIKFFFKKGLSQNLEHYGIKVIDSSVPGQDITVAVQIAKLIEGSWLKRFFYYVLCLGLFNYLSRLRKADWFPDGSGEAIVEVISNVRADGQELPEAAAQLRTFNSYYLGPIASSHWLLGNCLAQAAAVISSQINASLINHYANGPAREPLPAPGAAEKGEQEAPVPQESVAAKEEVGAPQAGIAARSLAAGSDWRPVAVFVALMFLVALMGLCFCIVLSATQKSSSPNKPKRAAAAAKTPEDYDRLIAKYTRELEANPKEMRAYLHRGNAYYHQKDLDRALEDYNRALELDPKEAHIYRNKGLVYYRQKDWDRALDEFNRALEIKPDFAQAHYSKAILLDKTGKPKEALESYQSFLKYAPPQAKKYIQRAQKRIKALDK